MQLFSSKIKGLDIVQYAEFQYPAVTKQSKIYDKDSKNYFRFLEVITSFNIVLNTEIRAGRRLKMTEL